jgi:hypothetical protein
MRPPAAHQQILDWKKKFSEKKKKKKKKTEQNKRSTIEEVAYIQE